MALDVRSFTEHEVKWGKLIKGIKQCLCIAVLIPFLMGTKALTALIRAHVL